jgi:hypothetical protein
MAGGLLVGWIFFIGVMWGCMWLKELARSLYGKSGTRSLSRQVVFLFYAQKQLVATGCSHSPLDAESRAISGKIIFVYYKNYTKIIYKKHRK